jgi:hypothetical protein
MEPESGEKSPLERVRERLYAQNASAAAPSSFPEARESVVTRGKAWSEVASGAVAPKKRLPLAALFLIIALGFFIVAGIVAVLIVFLGGRAVSADRIAVSIDGPPTAAGGEVVSLPIIVENKNPIAATQVTLSADFPEEAYSADTKEPIGHYSVSLADIPPGQAVNEVVKAQFFGAEQDVIKVPIKVEYHTDNSSATFVKNAEYDVTISSSPISITASGRTEASSGQPFTITASVRSNSSETLQNVAVRADYPFGFVPTKTDPAAVGSGIFPLGTFAPGETKQITITGSLSGEDGDQRVFKFSAGALDATEKAISGPAFTTEQLSMTLQKSFISTSLSLNSDETDALVLHAGDSVQAILSWINTLTSSVNDAQLTVALGGNALDLSSIRAVNGFYNSGSRSVVFDKSTESELAGLSAGESGHGAFAFGVKSAKDIASLRNPTITLAVSVAGRITDSGQKDSLTSALRRTIKVMTDLTLTADAVRTTGPFKNTGPWPPVAGQESTYTIRWTVQNSVNSVAGATVTATLPSYVRFTGNTSTDTVTYNESTHVVTWDVGDVSAGTAQSAQFQVGITPSDSQKGTTPVLIPTQSVSGVDRFVQQTVTGDAGRVDTEVSYDPAFHSGVGRVQ